MSLTSSGFFVLLLITFILYYMCPRLQKYVLLAASGWFYFAAAGIAGGRLPVLLLFILAVTYLGAILLEKYKKNTILFLSVAALAAALFVLKYAFHLSALLLSILRIDQDISWMNFASVMGMSYFTLSAIGYLIDVSWGICRAERNVGTVALFLFYFPTVISGPVVRYCEMREQYRERHRLDYDNVSQGLRRMIWGYFKKLVISDRCSLVVSGVYGNYQAYGTLDIVIATLFYAIQLYTDFSGCMDIVLGASRLFGVHLPENFNAPFMAQTVQEFWQRWHITLGAWFKDYVMYPVQKSKPMIRLGKKAKKRFGKNAGKKIPFYLAMAVLWLLIGIWHGGIGYYFMASAVVPFFLLLGGSLLEPCLARLRRLCRVEDNIGFRLFQRVRTQLLIGICWVFVCAAGVGEGVAVLKHAFTNFSVIRITNVLSVGNLGKKTILIFLLMLILAGAEYILHERNSSIKNFLDNRKAFTRVAFVYTELLLILFFAMVGNSVFIYFKF